MTFQFSDRHYRQYGLVDQPKLNDLKVLVLGQGPEIPYIAANLALLGVGLTGAIYVPKDLLIGPYLRLPSFFTNRYTDQQDTQEFSESELMLACFEEILSSIDGRIHLEAAPTQEELFSNPDNLRLYDSIISSITNADEMGFNDAPPIPFIYTMTSNVSSYIGSKRIKTQNENFSRNILTDSLGCITGGIAVQEILRQNRIIRQLAVTEKCLRVNFQITGAKGLLQRFRNLQEETGKQPFELILKSGGEELSQFDMEYFKSPHSEIGYYDDEIIISYKFPPENLLSRFFLENCYLRETFFDNNIVLPRNEIFFSPFKDVKIEDNVLIEPDIQFPEKLPRTSFLILGVGGTGSWLSCLLAICNFKKLTLILVDQDDKVELHNLNRQLLYKEDNIGESKVYAARSTLKRINPNVIVRGYKHLIDINTIFKFRDGPVLSPKEYCKTMEDIMEKMKNEPTEEIRFPNNEAICWEIKNCDMLMSNVDNIRARYDMAVLSKLANKILINSGGQSFSAQYDFFFPQKECYICRYGEDEKFSKEKKSCTGPLPIPSISTSISVAGAMQAAVAISILSGVPASAIWNHSFYDGKYNNISHLNHSDTQDPKPTCPDHLNLPSIKFF